MTLQMVKTQPSDVTSTGKFKPGKIVYSTYGYNMTIVDYFIVDRVSSFSVWLRPIGRNVTNDDGLGGGRATPDLDVKGADSTVFRMKIQKYDGQECAYTAYKSYSIWDGKPKYFNTWD